MEDRVIFLGSRSSIQSSQNLSNRSSIIVTEASSCERAGGGDGGGNGTSLGEEVRREGKVEDSVILLGNRSSFQSLENLTNSPLIHSSENHSQNSNIYHNNSYSYRRIITKQQSHYHYRTTSFPNSPSNYPGRLHVGIRYG